MSRAFAKHNLRSLALVGIAGSAACETSPEATELDRVVLAMGGHDAVSAATNERIVAHGDRYFPGQGASYTEPRHLSTFDYVRTAELDADRLHIDHDHVHDYLYDDRYRFTEVVDGTAGFVAGHDGYFPAPLESTMFSSRVTSELQHARLVSPLRLIREALGDPSRVTDRGTLEVEGRTYPVLAIAGPGEQPVELLIDPETHLPASARRLEDNPPLGDTLIEARFDDYRPVDGLQLPHRVDLRAGGLPLHSEQRSSITLNVATGPETYAIPASFQPPQVAYEPRLGELGQRSFELMVSIKYLALPVFYFDQAGTPVVMNELAPGVLHIVGMTHHSLLIERSDHLVMVETPTPFPGWSQAVLDEIKRRYPTKPIRYIVVSHFHNDHSGGIRNFVDGGGVTVLVGAASAPFYDRVLATPHTLVSDRLAERPVPVAIQAVEDRAVLADPARAIEVHHVQTTHANDMLIVYLPGQKLLFTADLFNPNFGGIGMSVPNPKFAVMARELYDEVIRLGLDVQTIAGAHGQGTATFEELRIAAGR
jgi:glyoxylase-like metal-dependent hydrolase (beta-lactamase superfamily II)